MRKRNPLIGTRFVQKILKLIRPRFPDLYAQCTRERRAAFIKDYAMTKNPPTQKGRRIGQINKSLQLLWVLGDTLTKSGYDLTSGSKKGGWVRDAFDACRFIDGDARSAIGTLCAHAFWEYVEKRFDLGPRRNDVLALDFTDWSISVLTHDEMGKMEQERVDLDSSGQLLYLVTLQIEVTELIELVKNKVDTGL